jgi:hypothetical protein
MGPWRSVSAPTTMLVDNCATGGGFDFTLPWATTMGAQTDATLNLDRPTDEARRVIAMARVRIWADVHLTATGDDLSATGGASGTGGGSWAGFGLDGSSAEAPVDVALSSATSRVPPAGPPSRDASRRQAGLRDPQCRLGCTR